MELDEALFRTLHGDAVRREEFERQSGVRHRKKFDERLVLEKIYRSRRVSEVVWGERPDFRLRSRPGDPTFGVEVVRFFDSPSSARLRELPGYSEHLLSGGSVRHKQDLTGFTVTKVQIIDQDGAPIVSDYPAIMRKQPSVAECVSGVCSVIQDKEGLCSVAHDLSHMNLIVDDRTGVLTTTASADFYRVFCTQELQRVVFQSRFREIFFLSRFKSGPAYVPLKMLLTLGRLFFFQEAVLKSGRADSMEIADYMAMAAAYLRSLVREPVGIRPEGATAEVLYGDSGFILSDELHTTVRTYMDTPWPTADISGATLPAWPNDLLPVLENVEADSTFTSEIAFPVEPR